VTKAVLRLPWTLRLAELAENLSRPATMRPADHRVFAWRRRKVLEIIEAGPLVEPRDPTPVPECTPAEVAEQGLAALTEGFRRPLVVRGFYRDVPAVSRWTPEYLAEVVGDTVVPVIDQGANDQGAYATDLIALPFREAIRRLQTEPLYINNASGVFLACPDLEADLDLDTLSGRLEPGRRDDRIAAAGIFIGGDSVGSPLHCAPAGNDFANLRGRKRWTLVCPELGPLVLPMWSRRLPIAFSAAYYSPENPKDEVVPHLPREEVVLEPGDMLYNAPWWWHQVRNLDAFTIGCAIRHRVGRFPFRDPTLANQPLYTAMSIYPWTSLARAAYSLRLRLTGGGAPWRSVLNRALDRKILKGIDAVSDAKHPGDPS